MIAKGLAHKLSEHPAKFPDFVRFHPMRIPNVELHPFIDLWERQQYNAEGYELSFEQRLEIERAYLVHILGVSEMTARKFHDRNYKATDMVGRRMSNIDPRENDYRRFWQRVAEITPGFYTQKYIDFLARNPGMEDLIIIELHATAIFETTAHCYK